MRGMENDASKIPIRKKRRPAVVALRTAGFVLACLVAGALLVNALMCAFKPHYYPTFGHTRLFAVVTDSMEPTIKAGSMIVSRKPKSEQEIDVGTVITYELTQNKKTVLITHRVTMVHRDPVTGEVSYTTRGDNAGGTDAVRPRYRDVAGVYTGRKVAVLGYAAGFLQSTEGAIALILIVAVLLVAFTVARFVRFMSVWRSVAAAALQKSEDMLAHTENDELGVLADVIGIAVKEPADKRDARRKDKKLDWFLHTGTLPERPYGDDLATDPAAAGVPPVLRLHLPSVRAQTAAAAKEAVSYHTEPFEKIRYEYTYTARLAQLPPEQKERYVSLRNELLSYERVRSHIGRRGERFACGRRTAARLSIRGKTLCLWIPLCASAYENTKYRVSSAGANGALYKIRSDRRAAYACDLIADAMRTLHVQKNPAYEPQDFYPPYRGTLSLLQSGLVRRRVRAGEKTFRVEEMPDPRAKPVTEDGRDRF